MIYLIFFLIRKDLQCEAMATRVKLWLRISVVVLLKTDKLDMSLHPNLSNMSSKSTHLSQLFYKESSSTFHVVISCNLEADGKKERFGHT